MGLLGERHHAPSTTLSHLHFASSSSSPIPSKPNFSSLPTSSTLANPKPHLLPIHETQETPETSQPSPPPIQMTWHPRQQHVGCGLRNLSNTCYLNAVLQCLTHTPPWAHLCLDAAHSRKCGRGAGVAGATGSLNPQSFCTFCLLEARVRKSLCTGLPQDAPVSLYRRLMEGSGRFQRGRQEDAHELLTFLLDACDDACLKLRRRGGKRKGAGPQGSGPQGSGSLVGRVFGGRLVSRVVCMPCGGVSDSVEGVTGVSLEVCQRGTASLADALARFTREERLDGDNKYRCDRCCRLTTATKAMSIQRSPNVLVVQFKRFENVYGGKIDRHISFGERLALQPYMTPGNTDVGAPEYQLFAVLVHSGASQNSGHYYAYVKDSFATWHCCDDMSVTPVHVSSVLRDKAYLLFYLRNTLNPSSSSSKAEKEDEEEEEEEAEEDEGGGGGKDERGEEEAAAANGAGRVPLLAERIRIIGPRLPKTDPVPHNGTPFPRTALRPLAQSRSGDGLSSRAGPVHLNGAPSIPTAHSLVARGPTVELDQPPAVRMIGPEPRQNLQEAVNGAREAPEGSGGLREGLEPGVQGNGDAVEGIQGSGTSGTGDASEDLEALKQRLAVLASSGLRGSDWSMEARSAMRAEKRRRMGEAKEELEENGGGAVSDARKDEIR